LSDQSLREGLTTSDRERLKALERESRELKRANEILRKATAFSRPGRARPQSEVIVAFIDAHRECYGVESICRQLPIAPSTYYEYKAREVDPQRLPPRAQRDNALLPVIRRV
jgi:putative transposase